MSQADLGLSPGPKHSLPCDLGELLLSPVFISGLIPEPLVSTPQLSHL